MMAQHTCRCSAYKFPHRFGGGKCNGYQLVKDHWLGSFGYSHKCSSCNNLVVNDDGYRECDVMTGGEPPKRCEIVMDFLHLNGIKL